MSKVYDGQCEQQEVDSGQCTTRHEQTPESYWCCCNDDYDPEDGGGKDGDGTICAASFAAARTSKPALTVDILYRVRDNLLQKVDDGRRYVTLYYQFSGELARLMAAKPGLATEAAKVLDRTRGLLAKLARGERVRVSPGLLSEVSALFRKIGNAADTNAALRKAIATASEGLKDPQLQAKLGITVKDLPP